MSMKLTVLDQGLKQRLILSLQFEINCEYSRFGMGCHSDFEQLF